MITTVLMPLIVSCNLNASAPQALVCTQNTGSGSTYALIAGRRQGPGPDHGGDPNDETHDGGLPSNAHAGDGYPSDDPYDGTTTHNKYRPNKPY